MDKLMELLELIVLGIGGATIGAFIGFLLYSLSRELARIHRVARAYDSVCDHGAYFESDRDFFQKIDKERKDIRDRVYVAERNGSNADYKIDKHIKDNKHTKTAAAVKRAKKQKTLEEDYKDCTSGDGM